MKKLLTSDLEKFLERLKTKKFLGTDLAGSEVGMHKDCNRKRIIIKILKDKMWDSSKHELLLLPD